MKLDDIMQHIFKDDPRVVPGIEYSGELPLFGEKWHVYLSDMGHCLVVLVEGEFSYIVGSEKICSKLRLVKVEDVLDKTRIYAGYLVVPAYMNHATQLPTRHRMLCDAATKNSPT